MDKIYECEDKIEEAKFLLSALKIETAFLNILRVAERKYFTLTKKNKLSANILRTAPAAIHISNHS